MPSFPTGCWKFWLSLPHRWSLAFWPRKENIVAEAKLGGGGSISMVGAAMHHVRGPSALLVRTAMTTGLLLLPQWREGGSLTQSIVAPAVFAMLPPHLYYW